MAIKNIKLRRVADLSIDKVHYCYFDEGNLRVSDVKVVLFHPLLSLQLD